MRRANRERTSPPISASAEHSHDQRYAYLQKERKSKILCGHGDGARTDPDNSLPGPTRLHVVAWTLQGLATAQCLPGRHGRSPPISPEGNVGGLFVDGVDTWGSGVPVRVSPCCGMFVLQCVHVVDRQPVFTGVSCGPKLGLCGYHARVRSRWVSPHRHVFPPLGPTHSFACSFQSSGSAPQCGGRLTARREQRLRTPTITEPCQVGQPSFLVRPHAERTCVQRAADGISDVVAVTLSGRVCQQRMGPRLVRPRDTRARSAALVVRMTPTPDPDECTYAAHGHSLHQAKRISRTSSLSPTLAGVATEDSESRFEVGRFPRCLDVAHDCSIVRYIECAHASARSVSHRTAAPRT